MKSLVDIMKTKENVYHLNGAGEDEIKQAEDELALSFAQDYRDYLKSYSLLSYDSHELTGICDSKRLNVVDSTIREKSENAYIPDDMYLLEQVGVENSTIWQNSDGFVFEVLYQQEPRQIASSLIDYVEKY